MTLTAHPKLWANLYTNFWSFFIRWAQSNRESTMTIINTAQPKEMIQDKVSDFLLIKFSVLAEKEPMILDENIWHYETKTNDFTDTTTTARSVRKFVYVSFANYYCDDWRKYNKQVELDTNTEQGDEMTNQTETVRIFWINEMISLSTYIHSLPEGEQELAFYCLTNTAREPWKDVGLKKATFFRKVKTYQEEYRAFAKG